jgi:small subunit ribosomal protein S7
MIQSKKQKNNKVNRKQKDKLQQMLKQGRTPAVKKILLLEKKRRSRFLLRLKKRKLFLRFLLRKFINNMILKGKEEKSERLLLSSFSSIYEREKKNPLLLFYQALRNSKPYVEVCSVRKGGASYQIPIPCKEIRGISLSMKGILNVARKGKAYSFSESLTSAFFEAAKNLGESVKKRDLIHGTALKNRSLTHYRWF